MGGAGGVGGAPPPQQSAYRLTCTIDTLVLEIPIDVSYELDRPYTPSGSVDVTFSGVVTLTEQTAATLIDAGVSTIDIISIDIASWVRGATPATMETSFGAAPINDFDLEADTDDNGVPGPHRLPLDTVTIASTANPGANEVELGLAMEQMSLRLGDFDMPTECLGPSLVGFTARFPVVSR
jgi:hypothetical protein